MWKRRGFLLVSQEEEERHLISSAAMAAIRRLIPSFNRVLVEKVVQPKKSAGGILLPETSKQVQRAVLASPLLVPLLDVTSCPCAWIDQQRPWRSIELSPCTVPRSPA